MKEMYDVFVIGAGASGMAAAIAAASEGAVTGIAERNEKVGRKLAITGKGRCNVTNNSDNETIMRNIPKNPRFMYSSLSACPADRVMDFFGSRGVKLKTERGNRVFPVSDKAYDIVDALYTELRRQRVDIINARALSVRAEDGGFITDIGRPVRSKAVIIATGGLSYPVTGSTGDGYEFARGFGHTITEIKPSLVPLETKGGCTDMTGLGLKNVVLSVRDNERKKIVFSQMGELLFTHFGISGPLTLSASSLMGGITEGKYTAFIDLKPALDAEKLTQRLLREFDEQKNKELSNVMKKLLPQAMIPRVLAKAGIAGEIQANSVTKRERNALVGVLKAFPLEITAYRPIEEAIITDGGVNVREIDPKTLASKKQPGLYFAGEILDVTGFTGGFNLQIAFSTGFSAGTSAARYSMIDN